MNAKIWHIGGLLTLLLAMSELFVTNTAVAQGCPSDFACTEGYTCRVTKQLQCSGGGCAGGAGGFTGSAGSSSAGASGNPGMSGGGGTAGSCDVTPQVCNAVAVGSCEPATCASDADCRPGMVCREQAWMDCSITDPCPQLTSCPVDPSTVESCSTRSLNTCLARNSLACAVDADCGDGFQCVQGGEVCTCTGGMGTAGIGSAGSAGGSPSIGGQGGGESCSCGPSTYCDVKQLPCATNSDCPSTFGCEQNPCGACGGSAGASGAAGAGGSSAGTAGSGTTMGCAPEANVPPLVCRPAAYLGYYGCPQGTSPGGGGAGGSNAGGSGNSGGAGKGASGSGAAGTGGSQGGGTGAAGSGSGIPGDHGGHHFPHWLHGMLGCSIVAPGSASPRDGLGAFVLLALCVSALTRRPRARKVPLVAVDPK
jgi:hypothetical protein